VNAQQAAPLVLWIGIFVVMYFMLFRPQQIQQKRYREMLGRIKETDLSVPYRDGAWLYYSRTEQGQQYPIFCRKKGSLEAGEEVAVDPHPPVAGAATQPGCTGAAPAVRAFDPRPHAPRFFAMQFKQQPADVVSLAAFRRAVNCLVGREVVPQLAVAQRLARRFREGRHSHERRRHVNPSCCSRTPARCIVLPLILI